MNKGKATEELLRYFDMLRRFIADGMLEIHFGTYEAYVTHAALHVMAGTGHEYKAIKKLQERTPAGQRDTTIDILAEDMAERMKVLARGIWSYCGFINANDQGFALFMEARERAKESPDTEQAVREAEENMRKTWDVSEQTARRMKGKSLAIHVVEDDHPHGVLFTICYEWHRSLILPWKEKDNIEIIEYRRT